MLRTAFVLLLALSSTACLRSTTVLSLKADGSGTILQETGMSPAAMGMLKSFAANAGGGAVQGPPPELFGEEQARKTAEAMGATFVSGEPIKSAEMEGYRARFSFEDIRKLKMRMAQDPTSSAGSTKEAPFAFEFDRRGASSVLTITLPEESLKMGPMGPLGGNLPGGGTDKPSPEQTAQVLSMMKVMMQGLFVDVSLDVDGHIVKTNANHVTGNRVTLLQLDFDRLLADPASLERLQGAGDLKSLAAVPGLKIINDAKISIEFAR